MIYFDHAATSPLDPNVKKVYFDLLENHFANSESSYDLGTKIFLNLEKSREYCAKALGVSALDIIFTSGASESNNMAIKSLAWAYQNNGKHIISSNVEHSSVLNALEQLESQFGFEVTYLPINENGSITLKQVSDALREDTILVSIMAVNNEIGSINPVNEIAQLLKSHQAFFHVDAVQALGKIDLDYSNFDLCSLSAHKIGGLKGSGILIKKRHINLVPLISGGAQEFGVRGGTSNALVHTLFYKTLKSALSYSHDNVIEISAYLRRELSNMDNVEIHSPSDGSPYILSFSVLGLTSEMMANALSQQNIYVSFRSTCHNRDKVGSITLSALGVSSEAQQSVLRLSFAHSNTLEEAKVFIKTLKGIQQQYGHR